MSPVHVLVCRGPDCLSRGAQDVYTALAAETHRQGLSDEQVVQTQCGCVAPLCGTGPVVCSSPTGAWYAGVTPDDVPELVHRDIAGGEVLERLGTRRVEGAA